MQGAVKEVRAEGCELSGHHRERRGAGWMAVWGRGKWEMAAG